MKHLKQMICLLLSVVMVLGILSGCGSDQSEQTTPVLDTTPVSEEQPDEQVTSDEETTPVKVEKTAIQSQPTRYVSIDEVGTYNEDIITPELLASNTLPQLDKAALPYWTGLILEEKLSVNFRNDGWDDYTGGGWYWNEE